MTDKEALKTEEDDGRVIAPMDVEGMPWYYRGCVKDSRNSSDSEEMSTKGKIAFTWGVIKAALLVAGVFIGVYFLFILFCTEVWFK